MGAQGRARLDDPEGEPEEGEELLDAARREFSEELGLAVPDVALVDIGQARQSSGKVVTVWAGRADLDVSTIVPGTFTMEWPPRSGRTAQFPEVDRAQWFSPQEARDKLVKGQVVFVDRLLELLGA